VSKLTPLSVATSPILGHPTPFLTCVVVYTLELSPESAEKGVKFLVSIARSVRTQKASIQRVEGE